MLYYCLDRIPKRQVKRMQNFKPGDIVYHKATEKRCVIKDAWEGNEWRVTTQDGELKVYSPEELWNEAEWLQKNKNQI